MKRKILTILLTSVLLSLSACSNFSVVDSSDSDAQKTEQQSQNKENRKEEEKDGQSEELNQVNDGSDEKNNTNAQEENKTIEISVYSSNNDATAFFAESVKINELTAENIVNALIQKSVVSSDVQAMKCEKQTVDGKESLFVDFNQAFGTHICSMGTTGEYYTIGSVVNTFLDAYGCEQMKITVEGNVLESGHTDYPGYMNRFE